MTRPHVLPWWAHLPRWGWMLGLLICLSWERAVYLACSARTPAAIDAVESAPLFRALWWLGRAEPWLLFAALLIFRDWLALGIDRVLRGLRRGVFLALCVATPGLAAESLKLLIRRLRPEHTDGWTVFAWDRVDTLTALLRSSGLGTPSGHVACACGAALALRILLLAGASAGSIRHRAAACVILLPLTMAAVRILPAAHFLTDVWISLWLAAAAVTLIDRLDRRNNGGVGLLDAPVDPDSHVHSAGPTGLTPAQPAASPAP